MKNPGPTARALKLLRKDVNTALKATGNNAMLAAHLKHALAQNDALRAQVKALQAKGHSHE